MKAPDDSTSHIRMVLTRSSEVIPIVDGEMQLGTWQGIFLFEHRRASHRRKIVVTVIGEVGRDASAAIRERSRAVQSTLKAPYRTFRKSRRPVATTSR